MNSSSKVGENFSSDYANRNWLGFNGGVGQATRSEKDTQRIQYLSGYIQEAKREIETGNTEGETLEQKKAWLSQALEMIHTEFPEESGWDPLQNIVEER